MKIYSVHSHKGGVGKTTFGLFLGKYLAQVKKEKTCFIDLDFQAQGLRGTYLREHLGFDFSDFLLAVEKKKREIAGKIAIKYKEFENLYFIASLFKPDEGVEDRLERQKKMYIKLVNEVYTGEVMDNLEELRGYLEKAGFKNIIIDDHPGLVLLSEEIVKRIKTIPLFITTANIVSFVGLFKNIMERSGLWKLPIQELKIIINRAPAGFSTAELHTAIDTLNDSNDVTSDEKLLCSKIKKDLLTRENGVMVIAENENIRNLDTIVNPRTILSLDIPQDLREAAKAIISYKR
jgi:MinD superfamily P-loop ATPase